MCENLLSHRQGKEDMRKTDSKLAHEDVAGDCEQTRLQGDKGHEEVQKHQPGG